MRGVIAVIAGMVTGFVLIFGIETLGHSVYPPPAGLDTNNPASMESYLANAPAGALLFVILAHFAAAFFGNITALLSNNRNRFPAIVFSAFIFAGTISLLLLIKHPVWFMALDVASVLAGIVLAHLMIKSRSKK